MTRPSFDAGAALRHKSEAMTLLFRAAGPLFPVARNERNGTVLGKQLHGLRDISRRSGNGFGNEFNIGHDRILLKWNDWPSPDRSEKPFD